MRAFFVLVLLALLLCAVSGTTMAYDGSYYVIKSLDAGAPMVPNRRYIHDPLQRPLMLMSQITDNVGVLQTTFGLAYVAIPFFALAASWWVVRKRNPGLFVWAAFGIGIGTLPGQIGWISEAASIWQLFWPVVLMLLLGVRKRDIPLMAFLCLVIFIANPQASLIFGSGMVLVFLSGWRFSARRRVDWTWAAVFAALCTITVIRFAIEVNPYETEQLGFSLLLERFASAFANWPLVALIAAMLAGLFLILSGRVPGKRVPRVVVWLLIVCGLTTLIRAFVPAFWADSLNYRFFLPIAVFPFMALALLDLVVARQPSEFHASRLGVIQGIGLIFAVSLIIQSVEWMVMTQSLRDTMNRSQSVCLSADSDDLHWISYTIFNHWSITPYSILIQGRTPTKIIMPGRDCSLPDAMDTSGFRMTSWDKFPWQGGWFDFRSLAQRR